MPCCVKCAVDIASMNNLQSNQNYFLLEQNLGILPLTLLFIIHIVSYSVLLTWPIQSPLSITS
jgi:hypothetical protein